MAGQGENGEQICLGSASWSFTAPPPPRREIGRQRASGDVIDLGCCLSTMLE